MQYVDRSAQRKIAEYDAAWAEHDAARSAGLPFSTPPQGPTPFPCKCGAPYWAHAGKDHQGKGPAKCRRYARDKMFERMLGALDGRVDDPIRTARRVAREERAKGRIPREPGTWGVAPSDTTSCPRAVWYREMVRNDTPPEGFVADPSPDGEAFIGTLLHDAIMRLLEVAYPWREYESPVVLPGLDTRNSKADWYDALIAHLHDLKSAGRWMWDHIGDDGPDEAVWEQVMVYAWAKIRDGQPVRTVGLTYLNRENGRTETFTRPYDPDMAVRAMERLANMATALELGQVLDRHPDRSGPSNDPICGRCFARSHCWNIPQAERLGRSPESYTALGAEPDDPTIEAAALAAIAARKARLAAEKDETVADTRLVGIAPGVYGSVRVDPPSGSNGVNTYAWAKVLADNYMLPDGVRPPIDTLPVPQKKPSTKVKVALVRAATRVKRARERLPEPVADGEEGEVA